MVKTDLLLAARAYQLRVDSLRATTAAGSGHPTSALSAADLISALFFETMDFEKGDHFLLSKGHAAPVLYAAYKQLGVIDDAKLLTLRQFDSALEGHPTPRFAPIAVATGSLGQGLANGIGMALAARMQQSTARTFVMLGDSECSEGSVWEAALLAAHYQTSALTAIVDCNRLGQANATLWEHDTAKLAALWNACGWESLIIDGHDLSQIRAALEKAGNGEKPYAIIARTIKGKGLPDTIADHIGFHGKAFSKEELPDLLEHLKNVYPEAAADVLSILFPAENTRDERSSHSMMPKKSEHSFFRSSRVSNKAVARLDVSRDQSGSKIAPRHAIGAALEQICAHDKNSIVLDAEVKNSTGTQLVAEKDPAQFFEMFIAEQSMIGIATGLAACGYTTFSSTFAAFLTRSHDQLRMAVISRLPLRVIGSHVGVSIGADGPSQMGLEDIAVFRGLYDSAVLYPCDAISAARCIELAHGYTQGICYIRSTRNAMPVIYDENHEFTLGGHTVLRAHEKDICLVVAAGITVFEALAACEQLEKMGIHVRVVDCYSIKPLPVDFLRTALQQCNGNLITVEDHSPVGGLGEAVAAATSGVVTHHTLLSVHELPRSGSTAQLMAFEKIDAAAIVAAAKQMVA